MKTLTTKILLSAVAIAMFSGCGPSSYNGLVNVVAVGAGEQPKSVNDRNYINKNSLPNIVVYHTPNIKINEQNVSTNTKYLIGNALSREFSGEPKILVNYLNKYQSLDNKVLILDKNGVVAWSGHFRGTDVTKSMGVYDYGFMGSDSIPFGEAMEKFVLDADNAEEYKKDKKNIFNDDNKYPFLFTKYPNMQLGSTNISEITSNNKPTVLVFFMSKDNSKNTLANDINKVSNFIGGFSGRVSSNSPTPQNVLKDIQDTYFEKK